MIVYIWNGSPPGMFQEKKQNKKYYYWTLFLSFFNKAEFVSKLVYHNETRQMNKKENLLVKSKILFKGQKSMNWVQDWGCLPLTQKNRLVDSCSKWDASNPKWKFPQGCAHSISTTSSWKMGSKAIEAKKAQNYLKLANATHIFHSEFPFGNFGLPFKKSCLTMKISVQETKLIVPFIFHPKFPDQYFWVNGKQPK